MTKSAFIKYHGRVVRSKDKNELGKIILELMHEAHSEPRDALLALAMANKRILYNIDYFDIQPASIVPGKVKKK